VAAAPSQPTGPEPAESEVGGGQEAVLAPSAAPPSTGQELPESDVGRQEAAAAVGDTALHQPRTGRKRSGQAGGHPSAISAAAHPSRGGREGGPAAAQKLPLKCRCSYRPPSTKNCQKAKRGEKRPLQRRCRHEPTSVKKRPKAKRGGKRPLQCLGSSGSWPMESCGGGRRRSPERHRRHRPPSVKNRPIAKRAYRHGWDRSAPPARCNGRAHSRPDCAAAVRPDTARSAADQDRPESAR
jgi:hypothetical protein